MNKLFELKFGSALYGTSTPNSDLDLKSIYIPEAREIVLGNYKKTISTQRPKAVNERNTKDDVDVEIFSLDRYLKLLSEGQTVSLDILFAPLGMFTYLNKDDFYIFSDIYNNREKLISKNLAAFIGYARQQAAKYGLKGFRVAALRDTISFLEKLHLHSKLHENHIALINFVVDSNNEFISIVELDNKFGTKDMFLKVCDKHYAFNSSVKMARDQVQRRFDQYGQRALKAELNEGIDWKALSHAVRVNSQGLELLKTSFVTFPRPDRELLLNIKIGKMEYNEVADIIVDGLEKLQAAQMTSSLRETPDQTWIDNFVYDVYSQVVKNG
jgi:predicted nucleotidyltransferase